jgi:hypothetical protein
VFVVASLGSYIPFNFAFTHIRETGKRKTDTAGSERAEQKTSAANLRATQENERRKGQTGNYQVVNTELLNIIAMACLRAQQDSFTYRAGKFVKRNRGGVTASVLVALSLVSGTGVVLWQAEASSRMTNRIVSTA